MDPTLLTVAALVAALGLPAGRVLNRLAHRVPAARSEPGPVATRALAVRPPWLELGTAGLSAAVVLHVGLGPATAAWLWFALGAVLLTVVDLQHLLLPNRLLLPLTTGAVVLLAGAAAGAGTWPDLGRALVAAPVVATGLLLLALANPAGLGMGDVKLGLLVGLYLGWLGWPSVLVGLLLAAVAQAAVGLVLLAAGRAGRRTALPFGPALLGGVLAVLFLAGG
ncbi:prepilin peptidase [Modestobacter sp. Leaf380]|uniref:prepilin peptidase n=1 Tax=Modestobacter sp. Leaf380 TaxID=1736356 RepID=UPI0006FD87F6|nr:prepilin peptidase [Modestobacter sp. Leaf380]KQS66291.1 hypothetical protein ASG41_13350 [Modestobacter sp. Leaf380]